MPFITFPPGVDMRRYTCTTLLSFSAEINAHTTETLIAAMAACAERRVVQVYLLMSTPGGNVMNGMNLYNVLRGMPFELVTHNVGNVESIGNAVFLAGGIRYAAPQATFMFHGVSYDVNRQMTLEEKILRETLRSIENDHRRIGEIISQRTHITIADAEGLFREAQTEGVDFALEKGIIHEVRDVQIPSGVPIFPLIFQR